MLVLGLMSGTSADGINVALARIGARPDRSRRGHPPRINAKLLHHTSFPFPRDVRAALLHLAEGRPTTTRGLSQFNFLLGELFARAALDACRRFRIAPRHIALIGSHGQTVFHQGAPIKALAGIRTGSTLQLGEPSIIAARTGIITVADFRPADMAVGGHGAPLVPYVDYLLYRHPRFGRVALNIGGIANVTVIPRAARPADVFAFDTGPGNMLIDALVRHFSRGRASFDRDARIARRGRLLPQLLNELLSDPYFTLKPPKTAGREQYGEAFVARILKWGRQHRARPADLVRTATVLTALSIVDAFHRHILPRTRGSISQLIVSGGGAHNPLLMAQLAAGLSGIEVLTSADLGLPADAKEAFAFAILAYETFHRRPANLPSATGARHPAILGKVCYASR